MSRYEKSEKSAGMCQCAGHWRYVDGLGRAKGAKQGKGLDADARLRVCVNDRAVTSLGDDIADLRLHRATRECAVYLHNNEETLGFAIAATRAVISLSDEIGNEKVQRRLFVGLVQVSGTQSLECRFIITG
jgi:hypothetical protein